MANADVYPEVPSESPTRISAEVRLFHARLIEGKIRSTSDHSALEKLVLEVPTVAGRLICSTAEGRSLNARDRLKDAHAELERVYNECVRSGRRVTKDVAARFKHAEAGVQFAYEKRNKLFERFRRACEGCAEYYVKDSLEGLREVDREERSPAPSLRAA